MIAVLQEWANLLVRGLHVLAAIMWIGDSFLFMWLDSRITAPNREHGGDVAGGLWMTHSGAFYEVVKRKTLLKTELPSVLYWFKWEAYGTWITGVLLLTIVYYLGNAAFLTDPAVSGLSKPEAIAISVGLLPGAFIVYDLLWRTPLAKDQRVFAAVSFALLVGLAYALTHLFSGRAAFLQLGATMGTVMSANVFFRIIPAQRHMLAATTAGTPVDASYGVRAKGRSIHNHYLTLPVLFTMLSNHFPTTYGSPYSWAVFALLCVFGASLKYAMNFRGKTHPVILITLFWSFGGALAIVSPTGPSRDLLAKYQAMPPVSGATMVAVMQTRCTACHAPVPSNPLFAGPPSGVLLDTPAHVSRYAERIFIRTVTTESMPLGNLTQMTKAERDLVGAWFAHGADIDAPGPVALPAPAPVEAPKGPPAEVAKERYRAVCTTCHGEKGDGLGPSGVALPVRPRNFTDPTWQAKVTDEQLAMVILGGGPAAGMSPLMPANADLAAQPEVIGELVKLVRGFGTARGGMKYE